MHSLFIRKCFLLWGSIDVGVGETGGGMRNAPTRLAAIKTPDDANDVMHLRDFDFVCSR